MIPEKTHEIPETLAGAAIPDVLLSYQMGTLRTVDDNQVTVVEKSRRIGLTWGLGAGGVLTAAAARAAGGMDVMYIGYAMDLAREFVDCAAMWARAFDKAAGTVDEFLFDDGPDRDIQAFRIRFASGFDIVALSSAPRQLRGRQGMVIIDEAAFHDQLGELLKAAMAFLIWGGKVVVVSTHNGVENPFNELVGDIREGRKPFALIRVTLDDALAQGLYRRICLVTKKAWSPEAEATWRKSLYDFYGEDAEEELDCVPQRSAGAWLSAALIEARMTGDAPVLRWRAPAGFVDWPEHLREAEVRDWCEAEIRPYIANLDPKASTALGVDFGRVVDLSVFWPVQTGEDLVRRTPFTVELRDVPFEQQKQILFWIVDRLPRFNYGAVDAGGNGAYLAEVARQRYGAGRIEEIRFTETWYLENMPPLKAAFQDAMFILPRDRETRDDFRAVRMIRGVARVPDLRANAKDGGKRHGDAAIAGALAYYASRQTGSAIGYTAAPRARPLDERGPDDDPPSHRESSGLFSSHAGAW